MVIHAFLNNNEQADIQEEVTASISFFWLTNVFLSVFTPLVVQHTSAYQYAHPDVHIPLPFVFILLTEVQRLWFISYTGQPQGTGGQFNSGGGQAGQNYGVSSFYVCGPSSFWVFPPMFNNY